MNTTTHTLPITSPLIFQLRIKISAKINRIKINYKHNIRLILHQRNKYTVSLMTWIINPLLRNVVKWSGTL